MTSTRPTAVGFLRYSASLDEGTLSDMRTALFTCAELEGVSLEQVFEIDEAQQRHRAGRTGDSDPIQSLVTNSEVLTLIVVGDLHAPVLELIRRRELRVITAPMPADEFTDEETISDSTGSRLVEIDLLNGRQWRVGTLSIAITGRVVAMRYNEIPLAFVDRHRFRGWLHDPQDVLAVDDFAWSSRVGTVQVSVKDSMPYPSNQSDPLLICGVSVLASGL